MLYLSSCPSSLNSERRLGDQLGERNWPYREHICTVWDWKSWEAELAAFLKLKHWTIHLLVFFFISKYLVPNLRALYFLFEINFTPFPNFPNYLAAASMGSNYCILRHLLHSVVGLVVASLQWEVASSPPPPSLLLPPLNGIIG